MAKLICKCCNEEHTGNNIRLTGFCFFCYVDRARECGVIKRNEKIEESRNN